MFNQFHWPSSVSSTGSQVREHVVWRVHNSHCLILQVVPSLWPFGEKQSSFKHTFLLELWELSAGLSAPPAAPLLVQPKRKYYTTENEIKSLRQCPFQTLFDTRRKQGVTGCYSSCCSNGPWDSREKTLHKHNNGVPNFIREKQCITLLGLLSQCTTNWKVERIEMYFLPLLEVREPSFQQRLFHQRAVQKNLSHVSVLAPGVFLETLKFSVSWLADTSF